MRIIAKRVILIVLDGFGLGPPGESNPVKGETMPFLNALISNYPSYSLTASGLVVGLPWGTYGNSEVGHSAMGTGRVMVQSVTRVNIDIDSGDFFKNQALIQVLEHAKKNNSRVHLVGCVSPGGIHSHENHLIALLDFFSQNSFSRVNVHMITDGEDSDPNEAVRSLERINDSISKCGARVCTVSGRDFAMDRVKNWSLTKKVWDVMVNKIGNKYEDVTDYINDQYKNGINDPDIEPAFLDAEDITVKDDDGIIFFNFRNDRMKQLVSSFVTKDFSDFEKEKEINNLCVATMTKYSEDFDVLIAYPPENVKNTLGQILSDNKLKQLRLAESEKEAHVTNFFDGGKLDLYPHEDRIIEKSQILVGKEYFEHPELALPGVVRNLLVSNGESYSFVLANFANTDVLAHTGDMQTAIKGLKIVDESIKKVVNLSDLSNTVVIITADHGNIEEMLDPQTLKPDTQHSTATVPIVFVTRLLMDEKTDKNLDNLYKETPVGSLIDIAPTVLGFLGIDKPEDMTGTKIIELNR